VSVTTARFQHINDYLAAHFETVPVFAERCGVSSQQLQKLVQYELAPAPSYVVFAHTIQSHVFGTMPAIDALPGAYFHPETAPWVERAASMLKLGEVPSECARLLRLVFDQQMQAALLPLHRETWPLRDSFAEDGQLIHAGFKHRLDNYWTHLLAGTFGLCVAHPLDEAHIARKEVLQEKLTAQTDNGKRRDYSQQESPALLALISDYETTSMPFSPIEYERSSRKRLVDDLRPVLRAAAENLN
jgi:hypothetical protein